MDIKKEWSTRKKEGGTDLQSYDVFLLVWILCAAAILLGALAF